MADEQRVNWSKSDLLMESKSDPLIVRHAKHPVFLDTYHANAEKTAPDPTRDAIRGLGPGGVDVIRFANDLAQAENGLVTFASTQGTELAAERAEWGHGALQPGA
jgi:hypothetical protein